MWQGCRQTREFSCGSSWEHPLRPLLFLLEHTNLKKNMEGFLLLEHLQRVLGFASEMKLSFDRHHTCHCIHWSGIGVGISGLFLTPRPQD